MKATTKQASPGFVIVWLTLLVIATVPPFLQQSLGGRALATGSALIIR